MEKENKKQLNIPKLRFSEFNEEWTNGVLSDFCDFKQGVQVDLELQSTEEKVGYLKFLRIENYTQLSKDFRFIPIELSKNNSINIDDVVVVRYGATAGFISNGFSGVLANNLFTVMPKNQENLSKVFLYKTLKQERIFEYLQSAMSGGAMPALSFSIMKPIKISFPSIQEQQKIADFLSSVDTWINNLKQQKENLESYKKGIMQKIFSQEIRFKDENGEYFEEWEEKELGDVAEIITGQTPPTSNRNFYGGEFLFVSPVDFNGQRYIIKTKTTCTKAGFDKVRKVKEGSVLFVCIGSTIGKIAQTSKDCITNQQINSLTANENNLDNFIYFNLLNSVNKIKLLPSKQAVPIINKSDFSKIKSYFPSLLEQQKIADFLSSIDNLIELKEKQINEAENWKNGLMQQMFV